MDCNNCGGKMVKAKYMDFEELSVCLKKEFKKNEFEDYSEWLKTLNENDLVLTEFVRDEFGKVKKKYYIRIVEKKTGKGIKLKKLSKIFSFDSGEIHYGSSIALIKTVYKIVPISQEIDRVIREYYKNQGEEVTFDIEKLNKIVTSEILVCDN